MYSSEDRLRAVELYIKYDCSAMAVVHELGYPSRGLLKSWHAEYVANGGMLEERSMARYSDEQKRAAVDHYIAHGRCNARTRRALGYPKCGTLLAKWVEELEPGALKPRRAVKFFTSEQKRAAVVDLESRRVAAREIADAHGVGRCTLYSWKRELLGGKDAGMREAESVDPDGHEELEESVKALKDQVRRLELERDILEGTIEILKKDPGADPSALTNREKAELIGALRDRHMLKDLLSALEMPRSSYQYQAAAMGRPDKYAGLRSRVRESFGESGSAYGYRRVYLDLYDEETGAAASEKVIARIMREEGLVAKSPGRRRGYSSYAGEISEAPANIVARDFHAGAPNEKWLTDITEFRIPAGKVYLSPVIDCFDGLVVSFAASTSPNAELANSSLTGACATLADGEHPIAHSDRGCHYRWPGWISICEEHELIRSMSKKGCSPDNSACEGFFGRLKVEFFYGVDWSGVTVDEFIDELVAYIGWYNAKRIKLTLGGMSPLQYRRKLGLAA